MAHPPAPAPSPAFLLLGAEARPVFSGRQGSTIPACGSGMILPELVLGIDLGYEHDAADVLSRGHREPPT